jgi:hypothetical protein
MTPVLVFGMPFSIFNDRSPEPRASDSYSRPQASSENRVSTSKVTKVDGVDDKEWHVGKEAAAPRSVGALQGHFVARAQNAERWDVEG